MVRRNAGRPDRPSKLARSRMLEGRANLGWLFSRIFFSYRSRTLRGWNWRDGRVWVSGSCRRDSGRRGAGLSRGRCRHRISGCRPLSGTGLFARNITGGNGMIVNKTIRLFLRRKSSRENPWDPGFSISSLSRVEGKRPTHSQSRTGHSSGEKRGRAAFGFYRRRDKPPRL